MLPKLSLRLKIILSGVVVFALAGLAMLGAAQAVLKSAAQQEAQRAARSSEALLSSALAPLVAVQDVGALQELADDLVQRRSLAWLEVVDDSGRPLANAGDPKATPSAVYELALDLGGQPYGLARYGLDQSALDTASQAALARVAAALLALLFLGAIAQVAMASWITRRLVMLRDTAQEIAQGQWAARVDARGEDEIADVAKAFQHMGTAIQQRMDALQAAQWRLQRLIEALSEGVLFHDASGTLLECNEAATQIFGLTQEQMMRKVPLPEHWKLAHPDGRAVRQKELPGMRALAQRALVQRQLLRLTRPDGSERWLSANATPLSLPGQDDPYAVVTSIVDVTDQVLSQERAVQAQVELERKVAERTRHLDDALTKLQGMQMELVEAQKLSSLGSMVAGISHELNTPIGNAVTTASSLQHLMFQTSQTLSSASVSRTALQQALATGQEMAELILKSTEKASTLIRSFKRVAVDDTSQQRRPFELGQLVDDLLRTLNPTLKKCDWTMDVSIETELVMDSFPGPLDQVLTNLIQNAQVHAFPGGRAGTLRITAQRQGEHVEIQVQDDGVGMSADVVPRVFEPFFTTRLGLGGSGLGLSIVRTLVTQKLGGTIHLQSKSGVGSTFTLRLPLQAPHSVLPDDPPQNHSQTQESP
jgi:PAS domain S-box-containing protein